MVSEGLNSHGCRTHITHKRSLNSTSEYSVLEEGGRILIIIGTTTKTLKPVSNHKDVQIR